MSAVLALGAGFVSTGVLPREALTSFVLYVSFISDASSDIADQWSRIQEALGAATAVFAYLEPHDQPQQPSKISLPCVTISVGTSTNTEEEVARYTNFTGGHQENGLITCSVFGV